MQTPENLTQLSGQIVARKSHPSLADYDSVTVRIATASAVEGKMQILKPQPGELVELVVRRELLGNATSGNRIKCRAKHSLNGPMCEPHPEVGNFVIE